MGGRLRCACGLPWTRSISLKHEGCIRGGPWGPARGCPTPPTVRVRRNGKGYHSNRKSLKDKYQPMEPGTRVWYLGSQRERELKKRWEGEAGGGILGKRCRCFEDSWELMAGRGEQVWLQFTKWPPEVDSSLAQWSPGPGSGSQNLALPQAGLSMAQGLHCPLHPVLSSKAPSPYPVAHHPPCQLLPQPPQPSTHTHLPPQYRRSPDPDLWPPASPLSGKGGPNTPTC